MKKFIPASKIVLLLFLISKTLSAQDVFNIIGGNNIDISAVPYQVSLIKSSDNSHYCGGAIINGNWILTAAHCVDNKTANYFKVHAGSTDQTDLQVGQIIQVAEIIEHPNYNGVTYSNDIALLRLSSPLQYNSNVQPIQYANECNLPTNYFAPGITARLTGWGDTCNNCSFSDILQFIDIPIISNSEANQLNAADQHLHPTVNDTMLALFEEGKAAADGDSGGPMVVQNNNSTQILIGASSWGLYPKDEFPTVYAKVINYASWIRTTTKIPYGYTEVPAISDISTICYSGVTFNLSNAPVNSTVSWTQSTNLTALSGQSTASYTVRANSTTTSGWGWVEVLITPSCGDPITIRDDVWVGEVTVSDIDIWPMTGYPYVCPNTTHSAYLAPAWPGFTYEIDVFNGTYSQPVPSMPHFFYVHMNNYTPSQYADASISGRINSGCGW